MSYRAFTVDRNATLMPGHIIDRVRHSDLTPVVLQAHVDGLFPDGVTRHGDTYFLAGQQSAAAANPNIELIFEYVRRSKHPSAPSRFESVFGCESLEDAQAFRADPIWGNRGAPIFEVEVDAEPFRADMTCVTKLLSGTALIASYMADRYWRQQPNDFHVFPGGSQITPFWELVLVPPVRVVAQVDPPHASK
jgi:hypothetical protein